MFFIRCFLCFYWFLILVTFFIKEALKLFLAIDNTIRHGIMFANEIYSGALEVRVVFRYFLRRRYDLPKSNDQYISTALKGTWCPRTGDREEMS